MEKIQTLENNYQTQDSDNSPHKRHYQTFGGGESYESESLDKLYSALCKTQAEMETAKTDSTNPHFRSKYADLNSVVMASRPYLSQNGLCVLQRLSCGQDRTTYLSTRLAHISGQWIESKILVRPPKEDIHSLGSYLTYLKRYCYAALVGVVARDEDDDGEKAVSPYRNGDRQMETATKSEHEETINKTKLKVLGDLLDGDEEILEDLLRKYKITKLSQLPDKEFEHVFKRIPEIKQAKKRKE